MGARPKTKIAVALCCIAVPTIAALFACDTECDKAFKMLAACCATDAGAADGNDCPKIYAQTFVDVGHPDAGPDAAYDAGQVIEVPCEGSWLDYARNLLDKGLDSKTCTVKP